MNPLPTSFFARPTLTVAQDLVGRCLVHAPDDGPQCVGRIVETEGYTQDDPAFHGWGLYDEATGQVRREGRAAMLFGPPARAYVYLIYGIHWLVNVVTEPDGVGGAVLIRAVEPVEGRDAMRRRRGVRRDVDLTNGPGKLTDAFGIDEAQHRLDVTAPPLYFATEADPPDWTLNTSTRIGISKGVDRPWRYFAKDHPYVSNGTPSGTG